MSDISAAVSQSICQYQLVIPLSEALQQSILNIRIAFYGRYKIPLPVLPPPFLPLLYGHAYDNVEVTLAERLQQIASRTEAFDIHLQNFASTPNNTICIPLAVKKELDELQNELRVVKSLFIVTEKEVQSIQELSVLVAAGLKPFQFIRMWMDCEHQQFSGDYTATEMVLQKRFNAGEAFEDLHHFIFSGTNIQSKQGVLFA